MTTRAGPHESHRRATGLRRLPGVLDGTNATACREVRLGAVCPRGMRGCSGTGPALVLGAAEGKVPPGRRGSFKRVPASGWWSAGGVS